MDHHRRCITFRHAEEDVLVLVLWLPDTLMVMRVHLCLVGLGPQLQLAPLQLVRELVDSLDRANNFKCAVVPSHQLSWHLELDAAPDHADPSSTVPDASSEGVCIHDLTALGK